MTTAPPATMHPTRASSGSYNSHPYNRHTSPDRTLPRIRLPPPYPAASNRHSISPVESKSPYPSLTPASRETASPLQNTHMRLPPVHSFSRPQASSFPPTAKPNHAPPSPPRRHSEQTYGHSPWVAYSPHQSHHPIPPLHSSGLGRRASSPDHRRYEGKESLHDRAYVSPPSPPLRPLPPTHQYSYRSEYVPRSGGLSGSYARSHGHSLDGPHRPSLRRAQTERELQEEREEAERVAVNQDTRRRNHLMSEQKRRESINSGFTALRKTLPSCLASDSKAIILRKATTYIAQLEDRLRREGITVTPGDPTTASTLVNASPNSWDDNELDEIQTNDEDVKPHIGSSPPVSEHSRHTDEK